MTRRPAQEIADVLRSEILTGNLRPGDQIPSEHDLARTFRTTRTTAQQAIAALRSEGHLISEHGRGTFVRPRASIRVLATGSKYRGTRPCSRCVGTVARHRCRDLMATGLRRMVPGIANDVGPLIMDVSGRAGAHLGRDR